MNSFFTTRLKMPSVRRLAHTIRFLVTLSFFTFMGRNALADGGDNVGPTIVEGQDYPGLALDLDSLINNFPLYELYTQYETYTLVLGPGTTAGTQIWHWDLRLPSPFELPDSIGRSEMAHCPNDGTVIPSAEWPGIDPILAQSVEYRFLAMQTVDFIPHDEVYLEEYEHYVTQYTYNHTTLRIRSDVLFDLLNNYWPTERSNDPINFTFTVPVREFDHGGGEVIASNLGKMIDSDRDGIPDWWEREVANGSLDQLHSMLGDEDDDGLVNYDEYLHFTSPLDPDVDGDLLLDGAEIAAGSCPRVGDTDGGGLSDYYEVAYGFDPTVAGDEIGDPDSDGLEIIYEITVAGTDPFNPDTDGDGMPDPWELQYGFDPLDALNLASDEVPEDDALADYDGDGLVNLEEYHYGSDPISVNSDLDFLVSELAPKTIGIEPNVITVPLPGKGQDVVDSHGYPYLDPRTESSEYPLGYLPYRAPGDYSDYPLVFGDDGLPIPNPEINPGFYYFDSSTTAGFTISDRYPEKYFNNANLYSDAFEEGDLESTYPESARVILEEVALVIYDTPMLDENDQQIMVTRFRYVPWIGEMVWDESSYSLVDDETGLTDAYEISRGLDPTLINDSLWESLRRNFLLHSTEFLLGSQLADDAEPDGMPDLLEGESYYDTIIGNTDSDNDGMPDGYELALGLDPGNPLDGGLIVSDVDLQDIDGDGLSNLAEMQAGLLPNYNDSDGDGLLDGWEVEYQSLSNYSGELEPTELLENLVVWWNFDSNDEGRVYDRSPYFGVGNMMDRHSFNDAFIHGSSSFDFGGINELQPKTLKLQDSTIDMGSYGYLATPDAPDLRLDPNGFTLGFWYRWSDDGVDHFTHPSGLLQIGEERSLLVKPGAYQLTLNPATASVSFSAETSDLFANVSVGGVGANQWHYLAVVYDGDTGELSLQRVSPEGFESVNGSLPANVSNSTFLTIGTQFTDAGLPLRLGALRGVPSTFINSEFDDFRLYQATLSSADIAKLSYPLNPEWDNLKDRDADGVTEFFEQAWVLSSDEEDSDGDGISDGLEVYGFIIDGGVPVAAAGAPDAFLTNPRLVDSDNDNGNESPDETLNDLEEAFGRTIVVTVTNREGDPSLAFTESRFIITHPLNPDTDGDGLSDYDELNVWHTDPTDADTDDDTMPDGWEVANNPYPAEGPYLPFDPLDHSGEEDYDGDGRNNADEYDTTNDYLVTVHEEDLQDLVDEILPEFIDSDGDGISDAREVELGTNRYAKDSDGDDVDDGDELRYGYDPTDSNDPEATQDSDVDGEDDKTEIANGTNPYDSEDESIHLSDRNILTPIVCPENLVLINAGQSPHHDSYKTSALVHFPVPTVPNPEYENDPNASEELPLPSAPWDVYLTGGAETEGWFANAGAVVLGGFMRTDMVEFEGFDDPRFDIKISDAARPYVEWVFDGNQSDWHLFYDYYDELGPLEIHTEENPFYHRPINLRRFLNCLERLPNDYVQVSVTYYASVQCEVGSGPDFQPPLGKDIVTFNEDLPNTGGDTVPVEGGKHVEPREAPSIEPPKAEEPPEDEEELIQPNILAYTRSSISPVKDELHLNHGDIDDDGVPNYADGLIGKFEGHGVRSTPTDEFAESDDFYELTLVLPTVINLSDDINLKITYDASNPADLESTDTGSGYEYQLPNEGTLRLWTKNGDKLRDVSAVNASSNPGDFIPSGVYLDLDKYGFELNPETGRIEANLYLETVQLGEFLKPALIHLSYARALNGEVPVGADPLVELVEGFNYQWVDIDIDSDNNQGTQVPARSFAEEKIENQLEDLEYDATNPDPTRSGKVIFKANGDADTDGVPDFADGLDLFSEDGVRYAEEDNVNEVAPLIPVLVTIPNLEGVKVIFKYDASDPTAITKTGDDTDGFTYEPASGKIRLWTKSEADIRRVNPISHPDAGDYVAPGVYYALSELGLGDSETTLELYLEAVTHSTSIAQDSIEIGLIYDPDGTAGANSAPIATDEVAITVVSLDLVEVDENNNTTPIAAMELGEPSPVVTVEALSISNIRAIDNDQKIVGDIYISGKVSSAMCDITPGENGEITSLDVYVNEGNQVEETVSVSSSKSTDDGSFLRPYPYDGSFSQTLTEVAVTEGENIIEFSVVNPITGAVGYSRHSIQILATSPLEVPSPAAQYYEPTYSLSLDFSQALDLASPDTITASLTHIDGSSDIKVLTETGSNTLAFEHTDVDAEGNPYVTFSLSLNSAPGFNDSVTELLSVTLVEHLAFGMANEVFNLVETGADTNVFGETWYRLIDDYELTSYADFSFSPGVVELIEAGNGGKQKFYMLQVNGPDALLAQIVSVETLDGPRQVEKSEIDDHYYVKMKNSPPAVYYLQPGDVTSEFLSDAAEVIEHAQLTGAEYVGGFVVGFFDGGVEVVEGAWVIGKFAVVEVIASNAVVDYTLEMTFGDSYTRHKVDWVQVRASAMLLAEYLYNFAVAEASARGEILAHIYAGDFSEAWEAKLTSPQMKLLFLMGEVMEGAVVAFANEEPVMQGYYLGRIFFEVVSSIVPPAKLTKATKLNFLNQVRGKIEAMSHLPSGSKSSILNRLDDIIAVFEASHLDDARLISQHRASLEKLAPDPKNPGTQRFPALKKTRDAQVGKTPDAKLLKFIRGESDALYADLAAGKITIDDVPTVKDWKDIIFTDGKPSRRAGDKFDDHSDIHHSVEFQFLGFLKDSWKKENGFTKADSNAIVPGYVMPRSEHAVLAGQLKSALNEVPNKLRNPRGVMEAMKKVYKDNGYNDLWYAAREWLISEGIPNVPDL
ncbi:LamG domain-containing protein [Cerasicoccus maritimus]|uniref:LamG domain-containing protein n=1 Tax=Cerasicoccus maritimus TaxID=490089 RepID=UPI00285283EB|nr:LamG-like jellyroll fold domain-containing protein [Cerasicoccus maritimus]